MKIIKDIIKRDIIMKWRVPSKSKIGTYYIVSLSSGGNYLCDCVAGKRKQICSHIKIVTYGKNNI